MPPFEWFVIHNLGLAMINLCIKFEVPTFTHCQYMKGNMKCRNWELFGVVRGHYLIQRIRLLIHL